MRDDELDVLSRSYQQANENVLSNLPDLVDAEPARDLSERLRHTADSYEMKRQLFYDLLSSSSTSRAPLGYPVAPSDVNVEDVRRPFNPSDQVRVHYPLSSSVMELLSVPGKTCEKDSLLESVSIQCLTKLVKTSKIIWNLGRMAVFHVAPDVAVKVGEGLDLDHIEIVNLVKLRASSISVPMILGVLTSDKIEYLFMQFTPGRNLDTLWPNLAVSQKRKVQSQLSQIFKDLRAISHSDNAAFGAGTPPRCKDMRRDLRIAKHLISSESNFNDFLLDVPESEQQEQNGNNGGASRNMIRRYLRTDHRLVLTHADLHPRNILVQEQQQSETERTHGDFRITGIIDWELAGWYPSYWEYVKALHTISPCDSFADWWLYLPTDVIGMWGAEHAIDLMVSRWLG